MQLLTFTKQQIFRLVQTESICRWQNKSDLKTEIPFGIGRKDYGKWEKMVVTSIFSFSHDFFKSFLL